MGEQKPVVDVPGQEVPEAKCLLRSVSSSERGCAVWLKEQLEARRTELRIGREKQSEGSRGNPKPCPRRSVSHHDDEGAGGTVGVKSDGDVGDVDRAIAMPVMSK